MNLLNDRVEVISRTNSDIADWLSVSAKHIEYCLSYHSSSCRKDGKLRKRMRKVSGSLREGRKETAARHWGKPSRPI